MNTNPQRQVLSSIDQHNLTLLEELFDLHANFTSYAQSINELFYFYVQDCTEKGNDLFLNAADIHRILEVVNLLQKLKEPMH